MHEQSISQDLPAGFVPYDESAPLDVASYVSRVDADAVTRGVPFVILEKRLARIGAAYPPGYGPYYSFPRYPTRALLELCAFAAPKFYPDRPDRQALRCLGQKTVSTLFRSKLGNVALRRVGHNDIGFYLRGLGRGFRVFHSHAKVHYRSLGDRACCLAFEGTHCFWDCLEVGTVLGIGDACDATLTIGVRREDPHHGAIFVRW